MSVTTKITVVTSSLTSAASLTNKFPVKSGDKFGIPRSLSRLVEGMAGGNYPGSIVTQVQNGDAVAATATVTCASAAAADTVTVGNVVFTAVSGTPVGNQFKVGVTNTADALSLVAAINANASTSQMVSAASALGVVTLTSLTSVPVVGNGLQLSSSNNTRLAVVAFSGGANDTASTITTTY